MHQAAMKHEVGQVRYQIYYESQIAGEPASEPHVTYFPSAADHKHRQADSSEDQTSSI
jgi:hypothetical protein